MATQVPRRPGSWVGLLILFSVATFVEAAFYGQLSAFTPLYLPRLGIQPEDVVTWTGMVTALANAVGIPLIPLWGALADRYARQPVVVRSFAASLLACLVMIAAGNIGVFVLGRAITGFVLGNSGLMMTTLAERTPQGRTGLAFAIMNSVAPLGAFAGPLMGGPVFDRYGFPALLGGNAILLLGVTLAMSLGYRDAYRAAVKGSVLGMAVDSVRVIWRTVRLRALFAALFLLFAGWMLAFTYVPLAAAELYVGEHPGTAIGLVMGIGGLSGLFLGPVLGALSDRYGHWQVLFAGAMVAVVLWPVPLFAPNLLTFTIAWTVLNGVVSGIFAISFTVLSASAPEAARGRVMSFAYLPVSLGLFIGPALGSLITRLSVFAVFPIAALITATGVGVLRIAYLVARADRSGAVPLAAEARVDR